jgi:hypothetical protein
VDSVHLATNHNAALAWIGRGPTLHRMAGATERPWPPTTEIRCSEISTRLRSRNRSVIVAFATDCPLVNRGYADLVTDFRIMDWRAWRVRRDSVLARIYMSQSSP